MVDLLSRICADFGAMFSRLGTLFALAVEQSRWDWHTFLMWGEAIALVSFVLAFFSLLIYSFARLVVWNTKRQVNDMRHLVKLMREGVQKIKADAKAEKRQD